MSKLATSAETLNAESDSLNDLISRFEGQLRGLNAGLEVWVEHKPLSEELWEDDHGLDEDDQPMVERGTYDEQLGFAKEGGSWQLMVRRTTWQYKDPDRRTGAELIRIGDSWSLLGAPRAQRINALELFPDLLQRLQDAVDSALRKIARAKQFVK